MKIHVTLVCMWLVTSLLFGVAGVPSAYAQVAYDENGAAASNLINVDSISIPAFQALAGTDRLLIVTVDYSSPATSVTSITFDAISLTHAVTAERGGLVFVDIWYLVLGDGGPVTGDINVTLDGLTNTMRAGAASFQNVDQLNPIGTTDTNSGINQTSSSVSLAPATDDAVVDAVTAAGFVGVILTPGGSQTEMFLEFQANFLAGSFQPATGGTTQMDWSFVETTNFVHAAVEINCNCNTPMVINGTFGDDVLIGGGGDDMLFGDAGDDTLLGLGGEDILDGGDDDDKLFGGEGDDMLDPGLGDNCIDGGPGFDVYKIQNTLAQNLEMQVSVISSAQSAIQSMSRAIAARPMSTPGSPATQSSNKAAPVTGVVPDCVPLQPPNPDKYTNSLHNIEKIIGSAVNDTFAGADGIDIFDGAGGDDIFNGGKGNDILDGGEGEDTVTYQAAHSAVQVDLEAGTASGGEDNDKLISIEKVIGSDFSDTLKAGAAKASLWGKLGNDTLKGGVNNDKLYGGKGSDLLSPGLGDDFLDGGEGIDIYKIQQSLVQILSVLVEVITSSQSAIVSKFLAARSSAVPGHKQTPPAVEATYTDTVVNVEKFIGGDLDDTFVGADGDDAFDGAGGNDVFHSGMGNDTLDGGKGDDNLNGGEGGDRYLLSMEDLSGHDIISDMQGKDHLVFQDFGLEKVTSAAQGVSGSLELTFVDGGSLVIEQHFLANSFAIERLEAGGCSYKISNDPGFESGTIEDLLGGCILFDHGFEDQ